MLAVSLLLVLGLQAQTTTGSPGMAAAPQGWVLTDVLLVLAGITGAAWLVQKILQGKESDPAPSEQGEISRLLEQRLADLGSREADLQRENIRLDLLNKNLVDEMAERENIARGFLELDRMHSMFSDEWRNSLNVIRGMSRALKDTSLTEEQLQFLMNIEQATAYLNASVLKALDFAVDGKEGVQEAVPLRKPVSTAGAAPTCKPRNLEGSRILVVEDNPLNQLVVSNILKRAGAVVSTANHGLEALGLYDSQRFDLILMDIQMPQMDGYRATAQIRTHSDLSKRNVPIIALTASSFLSRREKAELFGMNDHVAKPFEPEELLEKISNCL